MIDFFQYLTFIAKYWNSDQIKPLVGNVVPYILNPLLFLIEILFTIRWMFASS